MKAIVVRPGGGIEYANSPDPILGPTSVLIRVRAASVNRGDLRKAALGPPDGADGPIILGLDIAGDVVAIGPEVDKVGVGDRVVAMLNQGGYAELAKSDQDACVQIPAALSYDTAATLPVSFITAWAALFNTAKLQANETVLIHSTGSGVGMAGIQIAKRVAHATVFTTAGTADKRKRGEELGADGVFSYGDFADEVLRATGGKGVDVALDMIGGGVFADTQRVLAVGGRLISVGQASGEAPAIDEAAAAKHRQQVEVGWRLSISGFGQTQQYAEGTPVAAAGVLRQIVDLVADGTLAAVVDKTFPLAAAAQAHYHVERRANFGKVILHP